MDAEQIAEGKRLLDVVVETYVACNRDSTEATRAEVFAARVDRDTFLRNHARELLAAAEQREAILGLLRLTDYSDSEILQMIREVVE